MIFTIPGSTNMASLFVSLIHPSVGADSWQLQPLFPVELIAGRDRATRRISH